MSEFPNLQAVSDEDAYNFIKSQNLKWASAIAAEVQSGKTPEQMRDWWIDEYGRSAMATRIYHAARHIQNELRQT